MSTVSITDIDVVPTIMATGATATVGYLLGTLIRVGHRFRTGADTSDDRNDHCHPVEVTRPTFGGVDPLLSVNRQVNLYSPRAKAGIGTVAPSRTNGHSDSKANAVTPESHAEPQVVRVPHRVRTKFAQSLQTNLEAANQIEDPIIRQRALNAMYAAAQHTVDVIEASYSRTSQ